MITGAHPEGARQVYLKVLDDVSEVPIDGRHAVDERTVAADSLGATG
ncbi:MAG: hypothetical protein ABI939_02125 [Anaerolineaceae bacterium]